MYFVRRLAPLVDFEHKSIGNDFAFRNAFDRIQIWIEPSVPIRLSCDGTKYVNKQLHLMMGPISFPLPDLWFDYQLYSDFSLL